MKTSAPWPNAGNAPQYPDPIGYQDVTEEVYLSDALADESRSGRGGRLNSPRLVIPVTVVLGLLVVLYVAWAVDHSLRKDEIQRNVVAAGVDLGGLDRAQAEAKLARLAAQTAGLPVEITGPDGPVNTTAQAVGVALDVQATLDQAFAIGDGTTLTRPFAWLGSLSGTDAVPVILSATGEVDRDALTALLGVDGSGPVEPTFVFQDGAFVFIPGASDRGLDTDALVTALQASALAGDSPIRADAEVSIIEPELSNADAEAFVAELNANTASGLELTAGDLTERVPTDLVRGWLRIEVTDNVPSVVIDAGATQDSLRTVFAEAATFTEVPEIEIVNDRPVAEGEVAAFACCTADAPELILDAITGGRGEATLELAESTPIPAQEVIAQLGITELTSTFTTNHACCESRVTNIQRMADIVRGAIILPGESFSLNEFVGQRTIEKGFVEGGVIYHGEFQTDVGGGVSQFATTIFNAAFYAGLDFDTYQSHSIYISRYPYGIEATISWPAPDLQIRNTSPHAVLIWTSYTDTSITVSFYSTQFAEVSTAGQYSIPQDQCTLVITERLRAYPDGTQDVDEFQAVYQPEEGVGCDGESTNPNDLQGTP